jgi:hypothetical protein
MSRMNHRNDGWVHVAYRFPDMKPIWQQAAQHLHEAHTCQEWLGCGLSSWSAYVQTIPLSRMYDWQLRFVHRSGVAGVSYSFRAALELAKASRT